MNSANGTLSTKSSRNRTLVAVPAPSYGRRPQSNLQNLTIERYVFGGYSFPVRAYPSSLLW
jgi:hypothetical protein